MRCVFEVSLLVVIISNSVEVSKCGYFVKNEAAIYTLQSRYEDGKFYGRVVAWDSVEA